ncbi:Bro-N domain-containing protein, partial [Campylobacter jejuni]
MNLENSLKAEVVNNSNIVLFENEELGQVRVALDENNEPLFCLSDICKILEIQNATDTKNAILREFELPRLNLYSFDTGFGIKEFTMITEPQLYFILMRSDKPNAKHFRHWVTKEVLPSIRKKGYYSINKDFHPDYDIVKKQNDILNEMVCTQNNTIYNLKEAIKVLNTSVQTLKEVNKFKSNENVKKE